MKRIAIVLGLLFSSNTYAANWFEVTSDEYSSNLIDISSLKRESNGIVKICMKTTYTSPQKYDYGTKEYDSVMSLNRYNCPASSIMFLQSASYLDRAVVNMYEPKSPTYTEIIPESIADNIKEIICYKGANKKTIVK